MNLRKQNAQQSSDIQHLRHTVLRLTAGSMLLSTLIAVLVVVLWWQALVRLLQFGRTLDFAGLNAFGPNMLASIERYNPLFWWGVVIIISGILFYAVIRVVSALRQRNQQRILSYDDCQGLIPKLAPATCEVLDWVWSERRQPLTVGDLQHTMRELRAGRFSKLQLVKQQAELIDQHKHAADSDKDSLQSVEFRV